MQVCLTEYLAVCCPSLKEHRPRSRFGFFVYTMDVTRIKPEYQAVSEAQIAFLNKIAKKYDPKNEVIRVDVTELYEREFGGCPNQ